MITVKKADNMDSLKQYFAEIRHRINNKAVPCLHIINDFISEVVLNSEENSV